MQATPNQSFSNFASQKSIQESIRDDMSRSPKACSPTDRRVDYLVQAKQDRERRMSDKKRMGAGSISKSIFNPG